MNPLSNIEIQLQWKRILKNWQGRQWLWSEWERAVQENAPDFADQLQEWTDYALEQQWIELSGAVQRIERKKWFWRSVSYRCLRCESANEQDFQTGPCMICRSENCSYCERCIEMGRAKTCTTLLFIPPRESLSSSPSSYIESPTTFPSSRIVSYQLTDQQKRASDQMLKAFSGGGEFLMWAVTGAGKTEMMFPLIERIFAEGKRIMIASPRKDVILELYPRLRHVFGEADVCAWYGGSVESSRLTMVVVSTTHQLLRCREAFDAIVVDECDAFPFRDNQMLMQLARRGLKRGGLLVWLSATPSRELQVEAQSKGIGFAQISRRFHGFDLPVPRRLHLNKDKTDRAGLHAKIRNEIEYSLNRGANIFWFVPTVKDVQNSIACLRRMLPTWEDKIEGTFAADPMREQRVLAFRASEIRILVCTAILERGITLPMADVFVWQAEHRLFDEASLVQMAGRAGRSIADAQQARVFFLANTYTESQRKAIRQIRNQNKIRSI